MIAKILTTLWFLVIGAEVIALAVFIGGVLKAPRWTPPPENDVERANVPLPVIDAPNVTVKAVHAEAVHAVAKLDAPHVRAQCAICLGRSSRLFPRRFIQSHLKRVAARESEERKREMEQEDASSIPNRFGAAIRGDALRERTQTGGAE